MNASTIDPAAVELPPTQPIDMTALLEQALRPQASGRSWSGSA